MQVLTIKKKNTWFSRLRSLSHDSATDSVAAEKQSWGRSSGVQDLLLFNILKQGFFFHDGEGPGPRFLAVDKHWASLLVPAKIFPVIGSYLAFNSPTAASNYWRSREYLAKRCSSYSADTTSYEYWPVPPNCFDHSKGKPCSCIITSWLNNRCLAFSRNSTLLKAILKMLLPPRCLMFPSPPCMTLGMRSLAHLVLSLLDVWHPAGLDFGCW